jgi:DNA-binding MarR family transcriptional regulator
MEDRKKLIEEIMASFYAMKNKVYSNKSQSRSGAHITHSQLFVLGIIEKNNDIGIKEIAKKLNISSSAATQLVDGLVESGYVTRKHNPKDRRALHLELSTKGWKYVSDFKNRCIKSMMALFGALSDKELKTYIALHKKILK